MISHRLLNEISRGCIIFNVSQASRRSPVAQHPRVARESLGCFRASAITVVYGSKSSFNVSVSSFQILTALIPIKIIRGASLIAVERAASQPG